MERATPPGSDERYVITCALDKTVRVLELETGKLVRTIRIPFGQSKAEDGWLSGLWEV